MNLDSLRNAASELTSLFPAGVWPDLAADDGTSLLMPALAGIAAAVAVALALAVYFRTGHRSFRDIVRHGLGVAIALGLLAFAAYDIRNAAHADLAKTSLWSATEFELHWQKATARARELATEMDQRNRTLEVCPKPARVSKLARNQAIPARYRCPSGSEATCG